MDEPVIELDAEQAALRRRDADWVRQCLAGDQQAFGQLYDAWFDRVFDLVNRVVRDRDVAAEVAQEAFFSAWRNLGTLEKPDAFGGWLLRIARNGAYNRNQKEQRSYAVDDQGLTVIESVGASPAGAPSGFGVEDRLGRAVTPGAAVEDAEIVSLVWEAAEALPERDLEVLDLQLRHGLTPAEIGDVMGMNRNAANQLVHRLKNRLENAIRARVLWRGGSPSCAVLAQRMRDLGIDRFSADAVRVTERHVPGCVECDERQRIGLEPAALFAAVPLFAVPLALKQTAAAALAASGVPMGGSAFLTAAGLAGQAVAGSSLGSATGGAVDPGLGSNVGHAISTPGSVDPSLGGNIGHGVAPVQPGAPLGSQAGSSVGESVPGSGSGTGSGLGDAAGQSLTPPTPFDGAAHSAGDAADAGEAAESAASIAGPPPPTPLPSLLPPPGGGVPRMLVLSAAAVVLLALLFGGGLWWGARDGDADLVASGPPVSAVGSLQTSSTSGGSTSSSQDPTTAAPGGETTTSSTGGETTTPSVPNPNPSPTSPGNTPTTRATPPTTTATTPTTKATTPTTQPTTTTTFVPQVTISLTNPSNSTVGWYMSTPPPAAPTRSPAPVLTWSVVPAAGYAVKVTGPATASPPTYTPLAFERTSPTGSATVCPGTVANFGSVGVCGPTAGTHVYTITVTNGAGQVVVTKTATLTVTPQIL